MCHNDQPLSLLVVYVTTYYAGCEFIIPWWPLAVVQSETVSLSGGFGSRASERVTPHFLLSLTS